MPWESRALYAAQDVALAERPAGAGREDEGSRAGVRAVRFVVLEDECDAAREGQCGLAFLGL